MALSASGIGSNLDVNNIVSQLMSVERRPLTSLDSREATVQAKLSAYGAVKGALSSLQTAARALNSADKFKNYKATPADATLFTASASSGAVAGNYALEITALAQAQKLVSVGQASSSAAIGSGILTITFGTITGGSLNTVTGKYTGASFADNGAAAKTVSIVSGSDSLASIRDAINSASIGNSVGVNATLINDGGATPYRLALAAASSGIANSVKISVSGTDNGGALANLLAHDPAGTQNLSQTVTAQNAALNVDGVSISKASNRFDDVVEGVTLNLQKTNTGNPSQLSVSRDTASTKTAVENFVKTYNDLNKTLQNLSAYNASTKQGAILQGDAGVRTSESQIRSQLGAAFSGSSGGYTSLSEAGIRFQKDGSLAIDSAKLQTALDTNFTGITELFSASGTSGSTATQGYAYRLDKLIDSLLTTNGLVASRSDGLNASIKDIAARREAINRRLVETENNYRAQFVALDTLMSKLNNTGSYLQQQLANLPGAVSLK